MIRYINTLGRQQQDLQHLSEVTELLLAAAEAIAAAIAAANVQLRRAKELAAMLNDPALRRFALDCAGQLKANTNHFFPEEPCTPSNVKGARRRSRRSTSGTARAASPTTST